MAALSGALDGIQLAPLVNFLAELRKTGHLVISDGPWTGTIALDHGRVVGATFGAERGLDALDAIGLALTKGAFDFSEVGPDADDVVELTLMMSAAEVQTHLAELARESAALSEAIPSLSAVPRLLPDGGDDRAEVTLDRGTLNLLLALEAGGTVADMAARRGVIRTLRQMAQLVRLGLIRVDAAVPSRRDMATEDSGVPRGAHRDAQPAELPRQETIDAVPAPRNERWWRRAPS